MADYPLGTRLSWQGFDLPLECGIHVCLMDPTLTESIFRMARVARLGQKLSLRIGGFDDERDRLREAIVDQDLE